MSTRFWTAEGDAMLARLWAEGVKTAEIGRLMNTTKNAIVGRAHRLILPQRGSPIRYQRPPELDAAVIRLLRAGVSAEAIAEQHPISIFLVQKIRHSIGLSPRPMRTLPSLDAPIETLFDDPELAAQTHEPQQPQAQPQPTRRKSVPAPPMAVVLPFETYVASAGERCTWLEGNAKPWRRCTAVVSHLGSAWCACHFARVYVKRQTGVDRRLFG